MSESTKREGSDHTGYEEGHIDTQVFSVTAKAIVVHRVVSQTNGLVERKGLKYSEAPQLQSRALPLI